MTAWRAGPAAASAMVAVGYPARRQFRYGPEERPPESAYAPRGSRKARITVITAPRPALGRCPCERGGPRPDPRQIPAAAAANRTGDEANRSERHDPPEQQQRIGRSPRRTRKAYAARRGSALGASAQDLHPSAGQAHPFRGPQARASSETDSLAGTFRRHDAERRTVKAKAWRIAAGASGREKSFRGIGEWGALASGYRVAGRARFRVGRTARSKIDLAAAASSGSREASADKSSSTLQPRLSSYS